MVQMCEGFSMGRLQQQVTQGISGRARIRTLEIPYGALPYLSSQE